MSIVSTKATERSLQSFLERITQIETKRCKDDTHQSAVGKQIDYVTIDENNTVNKSHLQQHLKLWSNIDKPCEKDVFEKNSDLGGNFRVQWTLEHALLPKHVPSNQNDKPLEVPYLQSECACVEQKHKAAQSVHDRLYDFESQLKDVEQDLPKNTSYSYLKDNQQGILEENFYRQQQVPFLDKPKLSYQTTWRSDSPGSSYPYQQSQMQNDNKETNPECCESIVISSGESSKATRQPTQPSSRTKSHAAEPLNAFHPPPPPLQLRQKTNLFPLELLPASKRVQVLPSEYNYPSFNALSPSLPLTPVVSPVVKFVTPEHQVSLLQRMPSSNEEMEQSQYFQQHSQQLHEHQRLQFQERHQHYQQELLEYQQEQQRRQLSQLQQEMHHVQEQQHYYSQIPQPIQQQHFDYEQSQQQQRILTQQQPDETICIVERIYFSSPKNEREEITKTFSVVAPQQKKQEYQPVVAYSTPLPNKNYLLQKEESPQQYDKTHTSFEVVSENDNKVPSHLYLQETDAAVNDFSDVVGKPCYEFQKAHGDQLNTRKEFQTTHEQLKQEALTNSKFKQKTQLRCSAKARKQRLQRESIIRVQTANHQDTDSADEIPQNASFHSPPSKEQSLKLNNKGAVVQITKRNVSTQVNIGCCCMNW